MTTRTPEQVAEEMFASDISLGLEDKQVIIAAITTDRKERDLYELIAQEFDERTEFYSPEPRSTLCRNAAAAIRKRENDYIRTRYIAPMLDKIEAYVGTLDTHKDDREHQRRCNWSRECETPATFVGEKGFLYCAEHQGRRGDYEETRLMADWELKRVDDGLLLWSWTGCRIETAEQDAKQSE
jgi:hypothetical protein